MTIKTHVLRFYRWMLETDRDDRLETLRSLAEYYERKAREARREINLVMSESVLDKMRGVGL